MGNNELNVLYCDYYIERFNAIWYLYHTPIKISEKLGINNDEELRAILQVMQERLIQMRDSIQVSIQRQSDRKSNRKSNRKSITLTIERKWRYPTKNYNLRAKRFARRDEIL